MTEVKVKTEVPDDYIQEVIWQGEAKEEKAGGKDSTGDVPAEICVVIGGVRNQQTLDGKAPEGSPHGGSVRSRYSGTWIFDQALKYASGSYECGICGKKYKYYNCFQTHVRAHRDTEATSGEGVSQSNNFRYTCDICGKKYKYYSCFQEHRDLHAVDVFSVEGLHENRADPFDQGVVATDEVKESPQSLSRKLDQTPAITPVSSVGSNTSTTRPTRSTWPYMPPSVPPPGGSHRKIQTRVLSVPIQRSPHLHASWQRRPSRTSRGKKLQPPWSDAPASYTARLQPPKLRRSELQTRDLRPARQQQVLTAFLTGASLVSHPPRAVAVPLQEQDWSSHHALVQTGTHGLWPPL
nr:unnamed protein product [Mus musculus]